MAAISSGPLVQLHHAAPLAHAPCPATSSTQIGFHHSPRTSAPVAARRRNRRDVAACALDDLRVDMDDNPEGIISGEWPDNFSLLCYQDVRAFLGPQIEQMRPTTLLRTVMTTQVPIVTQDQTLEEVDGYFQEVSALPVVDDDYRCIGVYTKNDKNRAADGLKSTVGEVMSSPAITLSPEKTVMDAAILMLKKEVHKIPIVSDNGQVLGMVTRSDIYHVLEVVDA